MHEAATDTTELTEALAAHATRQREHAASLRDKAARIRARTCAYVARHPGQDMEPFRQQIKAGAEGEARQLELAAERAELRAARAGEGKLLHAAAENSDVEYLQTMGGYRLVQLARPAGAVVTE
jgi:hypothetical protein